MRTIANDINNLSKYKYVYIFYGGIDDWVKERYKIVYANKSYVYFKRPGCETLSLLRRDDFYDLEELDAMLQTNHSNRKVMYYLSKYDDAVEDIFEKCISKKRETRATRQCVEIVNKYNQLAKDVELKKAEMKSIRKKYPQLF